MRTAVEAKPKITSHGPFHDNIIYFKIISLMVHKFEKAPHLYYLLSAQCDLPNYM